MKFSLAGLLPAVAICLSPIAWGQHCLIVKSGSDAGVVIGADGTQPKIRKDGKNKVISGGRFALKEGGEYLPVYVVVRRPEVGTSSMELDTGGDVNKEFSLRCELESAFDLENVFLVILIENEASEKGIFLYEVGRLTAREPLPISVAAPMNLENVNGRYQLYLFSGGRELFQSMLPLGVMEHELSKMIRARIEKDVDAPVRPFIGPAPEYPRALVKKKVKGTATVAFQVDASGAVIDASVVSASLPEFGEAALAAIRQWWFLPRVKNSVPLAARVELPFEFDPPKRK